MTRKNRGMILAGMVSLAMLTAGCASEMFKTASREAVAGKISEAGLIVSQGRFLPETIDVTAGDSARVWIVNQDGEAVRVTTSLTPQDATEVGSKQIVKIDLRNLKTGSYEIRGTRPSGEVAKAVLNVSPQVQNAQVVVIRDFQAFFPIQTRVKAGQPLKVYFTSVAWSPHSDFMIYGTDAKLSFDGNAVGQAEITDGLKPGHYPITRQGYPGQNHGIKSLISAE